MSASLILIHTPKQRDEAFKLFPYPCIGQFRFLSLHLASHPLYPSILYRLKHESHTFLDAGCCMGQELRKLATDGAPYAALHGLDVVPAFFDLGYRLFRDETLMKQGDAVFLAADLLHDEVAPPSALAKKIDIIFANSLLHLFPYAEQLMVAAGLARCLRPRPGSLIIGRQVGAATPGEYRGLTDGTTTYRHDKESFCRFWEEVALRVGGEWKVDVRLDLEEIQQGVNQEQIWSGEKMRRLHFTVERIS